MSSTIEWPTFSCRALPLLLAACAAPLPQHFIAEPFPAADALFQRDSRWLGGDAVYSVDLGGDSILWLFGDSFVAKGEPRDRRQSVMVRNSIAIQHGRDPATATVTFHWRTGDGGVPAPFFPSAGEEGYWPLHGIRLAEGPLLLFLTRVRNTPGEGLGFAIDGWRVLRVDDPDGDPLQWEWREVQVPAPPFACVVGTSVWREGDYVWALATRGNGPHQGLLCRLAVDDARGGGGLLQWWNGDGWGSATGKPGPVVVLDEAGPECSLDAIAGGVLHVYSSGFGATTVAVHTARAATGPWSAAMDVFTPPESKASKPFVYAAKAHPELDAGAGWLAVSYAANSFSFGDLFSDDGQRQLYWPRFWRVCWQ